MSILYLYMGHYIRVGCIKLHYMGILIFKNSQFWHVLIKIRETWVRKNARGMIDNIWDGLILAKQMEIIREKFEETQLNTIMDNFNFLRTP